MPRTVDFEPTRGHSLMALALAGALLLLSGGDALAGAKLGVDYVAGEEYVEKGEIVLYLDLTDDDYNVIQGLEGEEIQVFIDDEEVPGTFEVQTAEEAKEWVAVAILMAGHRSYAPADTFNEEDEEDDGGGQPNVFAMLKTGFGNFTRKLGGNDRVSVFVYDEKAMVLLDDWSEDHSGVADNINARAKPPTEGEKADTVAPDLYKHLREVVDNRIGNAENLPRRRIVLFVTDGKDKKASNPSSMEKNVGKVVDPARTHGVKLYPIGFTLDVGEGLSYLKSLASKTQGIYREVPAEKYDDIPLFIENVASELKRQYVVTFTPHEDFRGAEKPVEIRVKVTAPGSGSVVEDEYPEKVKIGEKGIDWGAIFTWIGIILGSLTGLILVFFLIRAILRARSNRPEPVEEGPVDYTGPYKARLAVTGGPLIGMEYYLTEDVTTIGSIGGNAIVIEDRGVSKRHCGIKIEDMRFELADFGSTSGTFVNGVQITKQFLRDGDEIRMAQTTIKFTLK